MIHAVALASVGLAICSLAARRRAYAAGAVIAVFLVGGVVSAILARARDRPDRLRAVRQPARDPGWHARVAVRRHGCDPRRQVLDAAVDLWPGDACDGAGRRGRSWRSATGGSPRERDQLTGVSRWYGNVVAVNDVSFEIGPGITGLLGPNGAGKTTLLHMMAGFLAPSAGRSCLDDGPTWRHPEIYRRIGFVPEREAVYGFLTGRQFVAASAALQRVPDPAAAAERAIDLVELQPAADRAIGGYSKGMRQRVKVAAALVHDPPVLLLDEPFNGMDPRQRLHMMDLLRRHAAEGRTILFSSHILEEVERLSDRVLVVVAGRLAASGDFRRIRRLMIDRPAQLHAALERRPPPCARAAGRRPTWRRSRCATGR